MPNWTFSTLEVIAPSRNPRKGEEGIPMDAHGRISDLSAFMGAVSTPEEYLNRNGDAARIPFDFEAILPTPMELYEIEKSYYSDPVLRDDQKKTEARAVKKHGHATAYDFHCEVWGTKWNACDCEIRVTYEGATAPRNTYSVDGAEVSYTKRTQSISYSFNTAWSPAMPVILEVSRRWPKLTFVYFCEEEARMFESFTARIKAGEVLSEKIHPATEEDEDE
jgi:hypothetical protein